MSIPSAPTTFDVARDLAVRGFRLMETWDDAEASAIIAPDYTNEEAAVEPPAARVPGITGYRATYDWLHAAYADLLWTLHKFVAQGDWIVTHATMSGRQVGPFITYTPDAEVLTAFPATGRTFAVTQTHWYRIADGKLVHHRATRDDMGQAMQLGWFGSAQAG